MQQLQPGTTLQGGKYKIEKMLGQGGFGITYLALNTMLDGKVAVKEFFFKDFCDRDEATSNVTLGTSGNRELVERFKQKFIKEARTIFKLNHPNIVRILDIFEENATAYYVMEYIEGESLGDMVKHRGAIPEAKAVEYIREVASALSYIHSKNMNHLDIKPGSIMKRQEDGQVLVIDFGVAKQYDATTSEEATISIIEDSASVEKSKRMEELSPETDIYALGATLFKLLAGQTPPSISCVCENGVPTHVLQDKGVSQHTIDVICMAMGDGKCDKIMDMQSFIDALTQDIPAMDSATQRTENEDETTQLQSSSYSEEAYLDYDSPLELVSAENVKPSSSMTPIIVGTAVVAALAVLLFIFVTGQLGEKQPTDGVDTTATVTLSTEGNGVSIAKSAQPETSQKVFTVFVCHLF